MGNFQKSISDEMRFGKYEKVYANIENNLDREYIGYLKH